jgi:hypothetical protein
MGCLFEWMLCTIRPSTIEDLQTIMPMNPASPVPSTSQSDVDALSHGLTRWAHYPVPPARAQELATEFAQLHGAVQQGAVQLRLDDEPSAFVKVLQTGHQGG